MFFARRAETTLEEIVRAKRGEALLLFAPMVLQDFQHRRLQIVEPNAPWHALKELERALLPFQESFLALVLLYLGNLAVKLGDYPSAQALYAESIAISRAIDDKGALGVHSATRGL